MGGIGRLLGIAYSLLSQTGVHFMKRISLLCGTLLIMLPGMAQATVFSGRMGVSSYIWEQAQLDSTEVRHVQNTGTLSLRLARIAGENLTVTTSLRGRYDSRNIGENVDDYHVYNLIVRWKNIADRLDLTGGRHRIFWPTGSASIDGGSATLRVIKGVAIGGYFGTLAPRNGRFTTVDYDDGHAFGLKLRRTCGPIGRLTLAFAEKRRARSYTVDDEVVAVDNLDSRRLALDWRRRFTGFGSIYGHLTYNVPTHQIGRVQFSTRWRATPSITVNGQFRYRRPNIAQNSIFWVFGSSRYYEGRLRINLRLNPIWTLNVGGTHVNMVEQNTQRFDLGLSHRYFSIMLHGKTGGAGSTIGLTGNGLYPVNTQWTVRGGARYSSYELFEDQEDRNMESSVWGGVRWKWTTQSSIDLEGHVLTQEVFTQRDDTGTNSDFRIIARLNWWFFHRIGQ
jgi:hypothetical protein